MRIVFAALLMAGCVQYGNVPPEPTTRPTIQPTTQATAALTALPTESIMPTNPPPPPPPPNRPTPAGPAALPRELVGTWTQDNTAGGGYYFSRSAYQFAPDGTYALLDLLCSQDVNGTNCQDANAPEAGIASVAGNQLSLMPTTQSAAGPRTYTFQVVRDPDVGDLQLQFFMPDYVDVWFWLPE